VYPGLPLKVEYYLTDFSQTLLPIVEAMTQWGEVHRARLEQVLASS
jgi:DNA-binding HxlR family transcriptional regulator